MQHLSDGLLCRWEGREGTHKLDAHLDVGRKDQDVVDGRAAHGEVPDQLASDLKIAMQLASDTGDHVAVAAFLGGVEAGEQTTADGDQIGEQALAFGVRRQII